MQAGEFTTDRGDGAGLINWGPPELRSVLLEQLHQHGFDSDSADACVEQIAEVVGPAARASLFVDLGACRFLDGDVAGAIAVWRQAIASGQRAPAVRALFNLGLLHDHLHLADAASDLFRRAAALRIEPYSSWALIGQAKSDYRLGDIETAVRSMSRLAESLVIENPDSELLGHALLGLGEIAEVGERNDQAEQAYRAAAGATNAEVARLGARELVRLLRSLGHHDEADEITKTLPAAKPDAAQLLVHAESLMHRGRLDEASSTTGELAPDELTVAERFRYVSVLRGVGQDEVGLDQLEELAKSQDPETRGRATYLLGEMYAGHDMDDEARAMFERSVAESATYWSEKSQIALGDLDFHQGNPRSAGLRWALATASSVTAIATAARDRIIDALDAPVMIEASVDNTTTGDADHVDQSVQNGAFGTEVDAAANADTVRTADQVEQTDQTVAFDVPFIDATASGSNDAHSTEDFSAAEPVEAQDEAAAAIDADVDGAGVEGEVIEVKLVRAAPAATAGTDVPSMPAFDGNKVELPAPEPTVVALRRPQSQDVTADAPRLETASANAGIGEVIDLRRARDAADANPYAALAPSAQHDDVSPSTRNPYEELAPNYTSDGPDPTEGLFSDWSDPTDGSSFDELF